jgi:hypothetical protein
VLEGNLPTTPDLPGVKSFASSWLKLADELLHLLFMFRDSYSCFDVVYQS